MPLYVAPGKCVVVIRNRVRKRLFADDEILDSDDFPRKVLWDNGSTTNRKGRARMTPEEEILFDGRDEDLKAAKPVKLSKFPSKFALDPADLQEKSLKELRVMLAERGEKARKTKTAAIKVLSRDFEPEE